VAIPPQSIFQRFQELIEAVVDQIHNLIFKNKNLQKTRDLLLPRLISGELDVSELDISANNDAGG
jgi:type I restriction enzyme S subunit